jgi:peptidoglycan hydrolase CwlO-like protein
LYKNWVYTEEVSYAYNDKSARLYHFNNIVEETTHHYPEIPAADSKMREVQSLEEAQKQIKELEKKIKDLEKRIPQRYPDVKYLNYRSRKRILVSIKMYCIYAFNLSMYCPVWPLF